MSKPHTTLTDAPVCPACGHVHRDAWEWNFGDSLDGETEHDCDACGEPFNCQRVVYVNYTTTADTPANG